MELLRLNPTPPCSPLTPVPKCHIHIFLSSSRGGDSTTALGSLCQCLTTFSLKEFFPISHFNLTWCNLRPFPLTLSLVTWNKTGCPLLSGAVQSCKVPSEPLFLQAEPLSSSLSPSWCSRPFPSPVPCPGLSPASQYPPCHEGPKPGPGFKASAVPAQGALSLVRSA